MEGKVCYGSLGRCDSWFCRLHKFDRARAGPYSPTAAARGKRPCGPSGAGSREGRGTWAEPLVLHGLDAVITLLLECVTLPLSRRARSYRGTAISASSRTAKRHGRPRL